MAIGNELRPTREGYVEGLLEAGERSERVVALEADVSRSIGSYVFGERFPDRFFNFGASEQDMMAEAAGFALAGFIPFPATYAVFATGRAWDQIRTSICYMNLDVKIGGAHAGVSVGPDGATHQALEDIALMRVLPGMKVLIPADASQTKAAVLAAVDEPGPVYIRFGRNPVPVIYGDRTNVTFGRGDMLAEGDDLCIVACGVMVGEALEARRMLSSRGIHAGVINMVSVKPLDSELLLGQAERTGNILVAEDHQTSGGLFGAVAEFLGSHCPVCVQPVGIEQSFGTSGSPEQVRETFGLTAKSILAKALSLLKVPESH
jgi:transketolase